MSDTEEEFELLLSGYLDGELDADQTARFLCLLDEKPSRHEEVDSMRRLCVGTEAFFSSGHPANDEWDTFLDDVYNRVERRFAWGLTLAGLIALLLFTIFEFIYEPWGSALFKVIAAVPIAGLAILFGSVVRNRLHTLKTDRYEREVHR